MHVFPSAGGCRFAFPSLFVSVYWPETVDTFGIFKLGIVNDPVRFAGYEFVLYVTRASFVLPCTGGTVSLALTDFCATYTCLIIGQYVSQFTSRYYFVSSTFAVPVRFRKVDVCVTSFACFSADSWCATNFSFNETLALWSSNQTRTVVTQFIFFACVCGTVFNRNVLIWAKIHGLNFVSYHFCPEKPMAWVWADKDLVVISWSAARTTDREFFVFSLWLWKRNTTLFFPPIRSPVTVLSKFRGTRRVVSKNWSVWTTVFLELLDGIKGHLVPLSEVLFQTCHFFKLVFGQISAYTDSTLSKCKRIAVLSSFQLCLFVWRSQRIKKLVRTGNASLKGSCLMHCGHKMGGVLQHGQCSYHSYKCHITKHRL